MKDFIIYKKARFLAVIFIWGLWLFAEYSGYLPLSTAAYASNQLVYLSFYTVDDEEITELRKRIRENKEYTFKDPNDYRYLPYEDADGNLIYDERYDKIRGISWEGTDEAGNVTTYHAGDKVTFTAGSHTIRVKSDNPVLTGENLLNTSKSERAYLNFYTSDGIEIEELAAVLSEKDEYTFPDPAGYHSRYSNTGDGNETTGKGTFWGCTDDDKHYLFEAGDNCRFKRGYYDFYIKTDAPVTITFYYPIEYDTYFTADYASPGEIYHTQEARVGDTISLKKSLGALIWESTFKGWQEMNLDYEEDILYSGGGTYRITDNVDLAFYAVYEYDENWDMDAADENKTSEELDQSGLKEGDLLVDVNEINSAAGVGYGAYIDTGGVLRHTGGTGIKGTIKRQSWLTPLVSPDADPLEPGSYLYDKYGVPLAESSLSPELNNVLRQDDSALFMDVYGNSFIYYSQLTRQNNMLLAAERLAAGKTDSWVRNIRAWDEEAIHRFEAIEFALLKNEYPREGEELAPGLFWKSEYMSELAYRRLKPYKQIWRGWLDSYDDGLLEKYKPNDNDGGITVGKNEFWNLFDITAYADDRNSSGTANQIGSRVNVSSDLKDYTFTPQYYHKNTYSFKTFALSSLGLSASQLSNLEKIYNALISYGFSDAAAAGILSNIFTESGFDPKCANAAGTTAGLFQWTDGRLDRLKAFASQKQKAWTEIETQVQFFIQEYESSYKTGLDSYSLTYFGSKFEDLADPKKTAEAFCVKYEACEWAPDKGWGTSPNLNEQNSCKATNGIRYQLLTDRIAMAASIYKSLNSSIHSIGKFAGMTKGEIYAALELPNSAAGMASAYKKKCTTIRLSDGHSVTVHAAVATDLKEICDKLIADGFSLSHGISGWSDRGSSNSFHNFGLAVDINVQDNPCIYWNLAANREASLPEVRNAGQNAGQYRVGGGPENYKPGNHLSLSSYENNVFRSYGWAWAVDFQPKNGIQKLDYMHFSIGEVSSPGLNAGIFY